LPGLWVMKR